MSAPADGAQPVTVTVATATAWTLLPADAPDVATVGVPVTAPDPVDGDAA